VSIRKTVTAINSSPAIRTNAATAKSAGGGEPFAGMFWKDDDVRSCQQHEQDERWKEQFTLAQT
jgi:hypothetical protein